MTLPVSMEFLTKKSHGNQKFENHLFSLCPESVEKTILKRSPTDTRMNKQKYGQILEVIKP